MFKLFSVLFYIVLFNNLLLSQCSFPNNLVIVDDTTSIYGLSISGALDNDLTSNGLCGVRVKFRHTTVGEVSLTLVSPSGQMVNLIGPSVPFSGITDFTTWDITFVPCLNPVSPDLGFTNNFNTLQPWGQFGNYSGSYFPYSGCLQDFNMGTVDGTWSIVVTDASLFDMGSIQEFELLFCNDAGINCEGCEAFAADITNPDLTICQGDTLLDLSLNLIYNSGQSNISKYTEEFIVFNENQIFDYLSSPNLRFYNPGIYEICHIVYKNDNVDRLPSVTSAAGISSINQLLSQAGVCGIVSQECIEIEIVGPDAIKNIFVEACFGDSVQVFNHFYSESGIYPFSKGGAVCDSVFLINVDIIDIKPEIFPSSPQITCGNDTLKLFATSQEVGRTISYSWTTPSGNIISDPLLDTILVDKVGTYIVAAEYNGCITYDTVQVGVGLDVPIITLRTDTLTCNLDAVTITISSTIPLADKMVLGPGVVAVGSLTAKVDQPGIYNVSGTDANGCKAEASIEVIGDLAPPNLSFQIENANCKTDSAHVIVTGMKFGDTLKWLNPNSFALDDTDFYTAILGDYYLQSTGKNGCSKIDTISTIDESYTLNVSVTVDTIICSTPLVSPVSIITGQQGIITYSWIRGAVEVSDSINPVFGVSGAYSLVVKDTNDCIGTNNFNIEIDTIAPFLLVEDTVFYCITDSIELGILNPVGGYTYTWQGPINFMSTSSNPFIYNDGEYNVTVTNREGCFSSARIVVIEGPDLPKSNFQIQTLDCFHDTASIVPIDTAGFEFEWEGPGLLSSVNEIGALLNTEGLYIVTITQLSDNCRNSYDFTIVDEREYIDISISAAALDCVTDTIVPNVVLSGPYADLSWEGPSFVEDVLQPKISEIGTYKLSITGNNGCISQDSVEVLFDGVLPVISTKLNTINCKPSEALQIALSPRGRKFDWYLNNALVASNDSIWVSAAGIYTVVIEDVNGCVDSTKVTVPIDTIPPSFTLSLGNIISCTDTVSLISSGALLPDVSYSWSGPSPFVDLVNSIEVNGGGTFVLEAENTKGCITKDSINVDDVRVLPTFDILHSDINCNGNGEISIENATNSFLLTWNGPAPIADDTYLNEISVPGEYTVTATSDIGCKTVKSIMVLIDTIPSGVINTIIDTITCFDPMVEIGFSLAIEIDSIKWNGPINVDTKDTILLVDQKGLYTASIVGLNGCKTERSIQVEDDIVAPDSEILGDSLTCIRSKLLLSLSNYNNVKQVIWTIGTDETNGLDLFINKAGRYIAEIQGENGCIKIDSFLVIENKEEPNITIQDTFYLPCNGDSVTLSFESDLAIEFYRWIGNPFYSEAEKPNVLDEGLYLVFAAGTNGCNTFDSTQVVMDDRPIDFDVSYDTITCTQPFAVLNALRVNDDESFYWKYPDGSTTNTVQTIGTEGGQYTLVVDRGNNCLDSMTFDIVYDTIAPQATILYEDTYQCDNTVVDIQGIATSGRNTITETWTTADGVFVDGVAPPVSSLGTYVYTVVDTINGCLNSDKIKINRDPQSLIGISFEAFDPLCLGDNNGFIELNGGVGANGSVLFKINKTEFQDVNVFDSLRAGEFRITAIDSFGCIVDTLIVLNQGLFYSVQIIGDTIVELGDSILLEFEANLSGLMFDSISWKNRDSIVCADCDETYISPVSNNFYILNTVTSDGCVSEDSILIRVDSDFEIDIANIFSPNGDGINDVFKISELKEFDEVLTFMIFDRWGTVMHQEYNVKIQDQRGWDGTLEGQYALPGVYAVLMEIKLKNGRVKQKASDITLLR